MGSNAHVVLCAGVLAAAAGVAIGEDRAMDGSGNSIADPTMGASGTALLRMAPNGYSDGIGAMISTRPGAREISNAVGTQTAGGIGNAGGLSSMFWQWGQFIDHDFAAVHGGSEFAPISVPTGDPWFDPFGTGTQTIPFTRTAFTDGVTSVRQHDNQITHFLDGSMVYGSDAATASALRTGIGGRMHVSTTAAGDMLPSNAAIGLGMEDGGTGNTNLYAAGDARANEVVGLTALHTLFVREHNRLADEISATDPGKTDEEVYQRARKIVGAQVQAITYNEFLPALMGGHGLESYAGYDTAVDASMSNEFTTAAYRLGHTMLNEHYLLLDEDGNQTDAIALRDAFFDPQPVVETVGLDPIFRGLAAQEANALDTQVIDDVRNFLFGPPGAGGLDLLSLNLQRGRDHGIADYNTLRIAFGLDAVTSFDQITSDAGLAAELASLYGDVNDIDAWIGLMSEDHLAGANAGETLIAIMVDQFGRLRDGDRFYCLNDSELEDMWAELGQLTLGDIIERNTGVAGLGNVFIVPAPGALALLGLGGLAAAGRRR